jgi:hypothetical protein
MDDIPTEISNMDIVYVDELLTDAHFSIAKSSAADQTDGFPVAADMIRLKDRIEDLAVKWAFLSQTPFLDAPETHGRALYAVPRQSARMTNGISEHDAERGVTYINNLRGLVADYIELRTPNDFPEVSPKEAQVGAGR